MIYQAGRLIHGEIAKAKIVNRTHKNHHMSASLTHRLIVCIITLSNEFSDLKMSTKNQKVIDGGFCIEASALSKHARLMVMSKDWRGALRFLTDIDPVITLEIALGILKGELDFEESSSGSMSVCTADKESSDLITYFNTIDFQNAGLYRIDDKVYQPEFKIDVLGPEDFNPLVEMAKELDWYDDEFLKARILRYARGNSFVTFPESTPNTVRIDFRGAEVDGMAVIWKQVSDYPLWINPCTDAKVALSTFMTIRHLEVTGAWSEVLDMKKDSPKKYEAYLFDRSNRLTNEEQDDKYRIEDSRRQVELDRLKDKVIAQAGPADGDGWLRMPIFKSGTSYFGEPDRYLLVPKLAFYHWAMDNIPGVELGIHEQWKTVCPMGIKSQNDNPYHTDWILGAGLDPNTFYTNDMEIHDSSYAMRSKIVSEMANFEFVPLSKSDMRYVSGKVRLLNPGESLLKGQIGVIPHAGVEYQEALISAAKHQSALICATGGKLSHLAIVGREANVPVVMWDKAMTLTQFHTVSIDLVSGELHFVC